LIILTDSSPVFSCLGRLRGILSHKPLIIVAADDDDLEHHLRLRRGAPWVWKAVHDHGFRNLIFSACNGM
jgi:hypothetical protein